MADVSLSKAVSAYQKNLGGIGSIGDLDGDGAAEKNSFGDMLSSVLNDAISTQKNAETMKMQSVNGRVDLGELVTAVANAELSLNTVVAVRDRVISAYQEILRMPI